MNDTPEIPVFLQPGRTPERHTKWLGDNAIRVGDARVPWAPEIRSTAGHVVREAGWVLPGGERTTDYERAVRVAATIGAYHNRGQ